MIARRALLKSLEAILMLRVGWSVVVTTFVRGRGGPGPVGVLPHFPDLLRLGAPREKTGKEQKTARARRWMQPRREQKCSHEGYFLFVTLKMAE